MPLSNVVKNINKYVFQIQIFKGYNELINAGTGFYARKNFITNFHIFNIPSYAHVKIRNENSKSTTFKYSYEEWQKFLITSSEESSFDFAILNIPDIIKFTGDDGLNLKSSSSYYVGNEIAFLGYPFRQEHISCHSGIISAIYDSNITKTIQLDASVNHGNSGGPLFDPKMGDVIGVITRKATGLTDAFSHIRNYLNSANEVLSSRQGGVLLSGVDPLKNLKDNNMNMIAILAEIERQSNVGIGYAFSIDHILDALVHLVGPKMSSLSQTNVNPHSSS